jgi:hypothetical protein
VAERGEFELPVPISEQSDYKKMAGFAVPIAGPLKTRHRAVDRGRFELHSLRLLATISSSPLSGSGGFLNRRTTTDGAVQMAPPRSFDFLDSLVFLGDHRVEKTSMR